MHAIEHPRAAANKPVVINGAENSSQTGSPPGSAASLVALPTKREAERQLAEVLVKQGKLAEAERLVNEAQRRVGREDAWTRASLLHALGVVRAAQGRTDEAETAFEDALAIIEPTMYTILTNGVRASLESLRARATAPTQP